MRLLFVILCLLLGCEKKPEDLNEYIYLKANDDEFYGHSNSSQILDVLENDNISRVDEIKIISLIDFGPHNLELLNNQVKYTPKSLNYTGVITFKYVITDTQGQFDEAMVTLYISNQNIINKK